MLTAHAAEMDGVRAQCARQMAATTREAESLKELLSTYEHNMAKKDDIIANLTETLGKEVVACIDAILW